MLYTLAPVSAQELEAIQTLERALGKRVLALKQLPVEHNPLTPAELQKVREAEERLGLTLLVVK